ncbi:hypothetical protein [Microbacterium sp. NPDC080220]|uniref:rhamnosyltransferase WsaF family glycosyltransferase n=1 Tax=Microbacterium sp. NPDC080220 TaxID=3161017 RepID=UPI003428CB63
MSLADDREVNPHSPQHSSNPLASSFLEVRAVDAPPRLNLVLLEFHPEAMFAGVKTAIEVAAVTAGLLDVAVRLILLTQERLDPPARAEYERERVAKLSSVFDGVNWEVVCGYEVTDTSFGRDDIWVATHWMTAHALDVSAQAGKLSCDQVIYLVQDYEAEYFAGPHERAFAESTYSAGFALLVNGTQVARFLTARGHHVDRAQIFAPQFDTWNLQQAAARRFREPVPRLLFYGRPSKPRNMFDLGIAALTMTAERLRSEGRTVSFVMAGEEGEDVSLAQGTVMHNLGVLDRSSYFSELSRVDVGLALQATPHPSHMPFDLAMTGSVAVTNEVDGSRHTMHPRIVAVEGSPPALCEALLNAVTSARNGAPRSVGYLPPRDGSLGAPLPDAILATLSGMGRAPAR